MSMRSILEQVACGDRAGDVPHDIVDEILEDHGFDVAKFERMEGEMLAIMGSTAGWAELSEDERDEVFADNGFDISLMYELMDRRGGIVREAQEMLDEIIADGYVAREHTLVVDKKDE